VEDDRALREPVDPGRGAKVEKLAKKITI